MNKEIYIFFLIKRQLSSLKLIAELNQAHYTYRKMSVVIFRLNNGLKYN